MRSLLCAALALLPAPLAAQAVTTADLKRHIDVLASDAFEGRKPGTLGENKTVAYIAQALLAAGAKPAAPDDSWYQPVEILARAAVRSSARWSAAGKPIAFDAANIALIGRTSSERIVDAPVWFVGHGMVDREKGIDQFAGADLKGAVALMLFDAPEVPDFPSYSDRVRAALAAGAEAVIGIVGDDTPWSTVTRGYEQGQNRLAIENVARLQGAMPFAAANRLVGASGADFDALLNRDAGPAFRAVRLPLTLSAEAETRVSTLRTHNVLGRIKGRKDDAGTVLILAHWDHLGICAPEGGADRICNGAVDNASGIATMIEAAKRLGQGDRPDRDILFLATTAEEIGLLGAEYFARRPTLPLKSIVAAVNIDTVAIGPAGEPVAIIGKGRTPLDPLIVETATGLGRRMDNDDEAAPFIQRQDGWALTRAGVPAVMVGGSFSDMAKLGAFLSSDYHKPGDDLNRPLVLDGAAEDATLLVALARAFADTERLKAPN